MSRWVKTYDVTDWPKWKVKLFLYSTPLVCLVVFVLATAVLELLDL